MKLAIPSLGVMESLSIIFLFMSQKYVDPFETNHFYHIYNKTINKEKLFYNNKNYTFFLQRLKKYLSTYLDIFSFCLIPNHFHLLARVRSDLNNIESANQKLIEQFRRFFISYVQSINKQEKRSGSLLQKKFKRVKIADRIHLIWAIYYIHRNPMHHNLCDNIEKYKWSSYKALISTAHTSLKRKEVYNLFGGKSAFIDFHKKNFASDKAQNILKRFHHS